MRTGLGRRLRSASLRRAVGFLVGLGLGAAVVWVAGPAAVASVLRQARPGYVALAAGAVGSALVVWGVSLWVVLRSVGAPVRIARACWLFVGTVFLNSVTPFGQVGGDLPSGYLIARDRDARTEEGVAAIASVNTVNKLVGVALGVVGVVSLGGLGSLATGRVTVVCGMGIAAVGLAVVVWRGRRRAVAGIAGVLAPPVGWVTHRLPAVGTVTRRDVRARLDGFVAALERVGTPQTAGAVVALGVAGQLAVSATLWLVLSALGADVALAMAVAAVPVARLAALAPTPGGLGGVEVALAGVLVTVAGVDGVQAGAAAVLYRGLTFWLPLVPGAVVVGTVFAGSSG